MASLYGIETEDACRKKMDELLELCRRAERAMNKLEIAVLKSRLEEDYKEGDTQEGRDQMSDVESTSIGPPSGMHMKKLQSSLRQRCGRMA